MKKNISVIFISIFIVSITGAIAGDYKAQVSREKKDARGVTVQRPEGEKFTTKGSITISEGFKVYTERRFSETQSRIAKTEATIAGIKNELGELRQELGALKKNVDELKTLLQKEKKTDNTADNK